MTEEEEYKHFLEYYRIFFNCLPELNMKTEDVEAVANDAVYNYDKYSFFKDVTDIIPLLSMNYRLGVVSDAWPSLENVYIKANLRDYFSSFVISSKIGVTKPDEIMYKTALEELNIKPEEAIFIDDSIKNCKGAVKLGIPSIALCRNWKMRINYRFKYKDFNICRDLEDIKKILL